MRGFAFCFPVSAAACLKGWTVLDFLLQLTFICSYLKIRVDEERIEKKKEIARTKQDFKDMLAEAALTKMSTYTEFQAKHRTDPRYKVMSCVFLGCSDDVKAIEKNLEREEMFRSYIDNLRKETNDARRSREESARSVHYCHIYHSYVIKGEFPCLAEGAAPQQRLKLAENKGLSPLKSHRHCINALCQAVICDDVRYSAVESPAEREKIFRDYVAQLGKVVHAFEPLAHSTNHAHRAQAIASRRVSNNEKMRRVTDIINTIALVSIVGAP